jgi:antitoxin component YwqK of YwqJK toxin-antitoxin module
MSKETQDAQCMFIGSLANHLDTDDSTRKLSEKMIKRERDLYKNYQDIEERPVTIQLDEKKMFDVFGKAFKAFSSFLFNYSFNVKKQTLVEKLTEFFAQDVSATMVVYSGNAKPKTADWVVESLDEFGDFQEELVSFEEILALWHKRAACQKHLLIVVDSNYSGHWIRRLSLAGEVTVSVQTSCRYWQKSCEDHLVGSYFLHNFYKILKSKSNQDIIEPFHNYQTPGFYGNYHYVFRYFGLKLKYESWSDMRKALGISPYGNWPRISAVIEGVVIKPDFDSTTKRLKNTAQEFQGNIHGCKNQTHAQCFNSRSNNSKRFKEIGPGSKFHSTGPLNISRLQTRTLQRGEEFDIDGDVKCYFDKSNRKYEGNVDYKGNKLGFGVLYNDKLVVEYEGQFKDDQKCGKGVEYNSEAYKVYEGDFKQDKRNGVGKEFDEEGKVVFHGEFKEDLRNGEGKEFTETGKLIFHGHYKDGQRSGEGIEYFLDGKKKSEGVWLNGQLNGKGISFDQNGIIRYRGEFVNGWKTGFGRMYFENGALNYEGELIDGVFQGQGCLYDRQGSHLTEGIFVDGNLHTKVPTNFTKECEIRSNSFSNDKSFKKGVYTSKNTIAGETEHFMKESLIGQIHGFLEEGKHGFEQSVHTAIIPDNKNFVFDVTTQDVNQLPDKLSIDIGNKFMHKLRKESIDREKARSTLDQSKNFESLEKLSLNPSINFDMSTVHNHPMTETQQRPLPEDKSTVIFYDYSDEFRSRLHDPAKPSITHTDRSFQMTQDITHLGPAKIGVVIARKSESVDQFHADVISTEKVGEFVIRDSEFSIGDKGKIKDIMKNLSRKNSGTHTKKSLNDSQGLKGNPFLQSGVTDVKDNTGIEPKAPTSKFKPEDMIEIPDDGMFSYGRPSLDDHQNIFEDSFGNVRNSAPINSRGSQGLKIKDLMAKKSDSDSHHDLQSPSFNGTRNVSGSKSMTNQARNSQEIADGIRKPSFKASVEVISDV